MVCRQSEGLFLLMYNAVLICSAFSAHDLSACFRLYTAQPMIVSPHLQNKNRHHTVYGTISPTACPSTLFLLYSACCIESGFCNNSRRTVSSHIQHTPPQMDGLPIPNHFTRHTLYLLPVPSCTILYWAPILLSSIPSRTVAQRFSVDDTRTSTIVAVPILSC